MKDWNEITPLRILLVILGIIVLIAFLPGCTIYESTSSTPHHTCELMERGQACLSDHSCCKEDKDEELSYWRVNYVPTVGVYYYNDIPYWGYYSGYYYYYGSRHIYPWWYYYNSLPPYYYGATTHVHCHIGNTGYVYRPRGNWRHNNKTNLTYHHDNVHTTGINVKGYSNVPTKWKNNVKTNIRTNTNKTYINKSNNSTIKTNKSNTIKINRSNTNKINTNKSNNTKININKSTNNRSVKPNKNNTNRRSNTKSNRKPR